MQHCNNAFVRAEVTIEHVLINVIVIGFLVMESLLVSTSAAFLGLEALLLIVAPLLKGDLSSTFVAIRKLAAILVLQRVELFAVGTFVSFFAAMIAASTKDKLPCSLESRVG